MKTPVTALILGLFAGAAILTGQERELVVNGSLEQTTHNFPTGWQKTEDENNRVTATWMVDEDAMSGKVFRIVCTEFPAPVAGKPGSSYADFLQRGIPLAAGQKYTLSFKARAIGVREGGFSVWMQDTAKPASPALHKTAKAIHLWQEFQFEFTAPFDVPRETSRLRFVVESTGTLWLDDISLRGGPGTVTADQSAVPKLQPRLARLPAKNLVPNGSFECGADGWLSQGVPVGWGAGLTGLYGGVEPGQGPDGSHAYRLQLGPGLTPESYFDFWELEHVVHRRLLIANRGWIDVEPGRSYTLSAWMRTDKPGTKGILQFAFNGDAREKVQRESHEVALTAEWQRYSFTVVAPADGVCVAVGPDVRDFPSENVTFWADAIQLEAGEKATAFAPREAVELGFNSGKYGNIYTVGTPAAIGVTVHNGTKAVTEIPVEASITDYWDRSVSTRTLSLTVPAEGTVVQPLPLELPPGFYRARFSWTTGDGRQSRAVTLAIIEPYSHPDSPFGLNHAPTSAEAFEQMRQAGVTWIRDSSVNWEWAEPKPGRISFTPIDPNIARLRAEKMNIMSLLPAQPSTRWASEAPDSVTWEAWYRQAYMPKDPGRLYDFIAKAATHYKGWISHWEFLNEPLWVPDFCLPKRGGYTIDTYITLLKKASAIIRSANPEAKILGGLSIQSEIIFGDEFIKAGGLDYVDIYNLHPYAHTRAPESFISDMERIRRVMDEYGVRKKMWATETAYYGIDEYPYLPWQVPVGHFAAERLLNNEKEAGDYTVRFCTILLAYGVEKIFWHAPVTGDVNYALDDIMNNLVAQGGVPRKAFVTHLTLANALGPNPVYGGRLQVPKEVSGRSTDNVYGYAFDCGDRSVLVTWATGKEAANAWALDLPEQATVRNITGAPLPGPKVALSESPVFITSKSHTPGELARRCILKTP